MDQDLLIVLDCQFNMFHEDGSFVFGVFVQTDFADPQHVFALQELGDHLDYLARQFDVFGFFGINAKPCVMLDSILSRSSRLDIGQLVKVVAKAVHRTAIKSSPEGRFAHSDTPHFGERFVIVGCARNHVDVRIDVVH